VKIDKYFLFAFLIILFGFCLRVYQLGHSSFWYDEAGQALAATQPTIRNMLGIVRSHAMAMPLDYFVARMFSNLGVTEFILRIPSAIWGTLTLTIYYIFMKRWYGTKTALFFVWLLAISPQLIHYSQELRFYSALIFFYALSNLCLFRAVFQPSKSAWLVYSFVTTIGAYFCPYVLLSMLNGLLYLSFHQEIPSAHYKKLIAFGGRALLNGILFLPGYFVFGAHHKFHYELFQWEPFIMIFYGLGWRAMHSSELIFGMSEFLNVGFVLVGLLSVIMNYQKNRLLLSMAIGVFIQIGIIILLDWMKGYWFYPRQLVYLIPTMIMLIVVGLVSLSDYISRLFKIPSIKTWCALTLIILITLSSRPRLEDYYQFTKSTAREIASKLIEIHGEGEPVFVIPWYERVTYQFYLLQLQRGQNIILKEFRPIDWKQLPSAVTGISKTTYLITNKFRQLVFFSKEDKEKREILESLEFKKCFIPQKQGFDTQILYRRAGSK